MTELYVMRQAVIRALMTACLGEAYPQEHPVCHCPTDAVALNRRDRRRFRTEATAAIEHRAGCPLGPPLQSGRWAPRRRG